ncbi:Six-hairpin glycosidase-like protein [Panaeolus papilionaceus]|nr:Six-hairpin glycosidase-like protein [Panaeolus papilionaceus]
MSMGDMKRARGGNRTGKTKTALLVGALVAGLSVLGTTNAQQLSDAQVGIVGQRMAELSLLSWEIGTHAQTILEANATLYSVLSSQSLPPPRSIPSSSSSLYSSSPSLPSALQPFFDIAREVVGNRTTANNNTQGAQPLMPDGSAADPASIGVCVLIANWTGRGEKDNLDYVGAAQDQLDFLLNEVPRTGDGAISHRVSEVQLWNDFVYMVPPFLAYHGVVTRNRTLVAEGFNQIKLYRQYLRDAQTGLWHHVMEGTKGNDPGFWATGHGWAAAGMLRVLMTMRNSEYANTFHDEQNQLSSWVTEIHDAVYQYLDQTSIFTNYINQPPTASNNFYDASSSALIASTVYKASLLTGQNKHVPQAERVRKALASSNNGKGGDDFSGGYKHFTSDGYLTPVVNPHSFGEQGSQSAEGQAFVVQMESAWREWVKNGSKGANAGVSVRLGGGMGKMVVGVMVVGVWGVVGLV